MERRRETIIVGLLGFFGDRPVADFEGEAGGALLASYVLACAQASQAKVIRPGLMLLRRALSRVLDQLPTPWPREADWIRDAADAPLARRLAEARRTRRHTDVPRSVLVGLRLNRYERAAAALDLAEAEARGLKRPLTRGECPPDDQPCPWVSCRAHLGLELELKKRVVLKIVFPDRPIDKMPETCSLRAAERFLERGEIQKDGKRSPLGTKPVASLTEVGELLNLTPERVRNIEHAALAKLRHLPVFQDDMPRGIAR